MLDVLYSSVVPMTSAVFSRRQDSPILPRVWSEADAYLTDMRQEMSPVQKSPRLCGRRTSFVTALEQG